MRLRAECRVLVRPALAGPSVTEAPRAALDSPLIETRPDVVFLGEPASFETALVGAKAASLGLLAVDFPVPPGFCLTAEVFVRFAPSADTAMAELRALVAPAYERLARGGVVRVAVRSSAIGEDASGASFAGQHDTYLDISGIDAVVDAIVRCWASLRNERALAYRERQGLGTGGVMPVLVQQLVPADAAAVAFSADPLSGDRGVVRINVARGLGEALVSGLVTPDVYLVAKEPLAIRARTIAEDAPALDDGTVLEIARLTAALERRMEHPVDVECAIAAGSVHVVQCRPITTLPEPFELQWPEPSFERLSWGRDFLHAPEPVPPLSAEMFLLAHPAMGDATTHFESPFRARSLLMNGYVFTSSELLTDDDDELSARLAAARDKRRAFGRKLPEFWERKILPYLREFYAWIVAAPIATASGSEASNLWEECWSRLLHVWQLHFYVVGTAYPVLDELASLYEQLFPRRRGPEALALTQGLTDDVQDMQADLYDLAETARAEGESSPEFRALLGAFLERHGHLGHTHNDLRQPSWGDEPERVIEEVRKRVAYPGDDPRVRRRRALAVAADLEARIRRDLANRPDDLARFEEVLAAARGVAPLTEGHNYELDRKSQTLLRRFVLRVGERLARAGAIDAPADVFYLYRREIAEALVDERDRRALVAERAAELQRQTRMRPPQAIGAPPRRLPPAFARNRYFGGPVAGEPGVLRGTGASAGLARGPARKVKGPDDFARLRPGDVLVCHSTNPTYVPLFGVAAAIVTDVGGELCHAAVVAREFGVPAVVGASDAVAKIRNGQMLEVDGGAGTVRLLD